MNGSNANHVFITTRDVIIIRAKLHIMKIIYNLKTPNHALESISEVNITVYIVIQRQQPADIQ